jgi:enoyl-CoA hydratase/carnithine racemase
MYNKVADVLRAADKDPKILFCCLTGAGDYYCSGTDLSTFMTPEALSNLEKATADGGLIMDNFVTAFIDFSKPLVASNNDLLFMIRS